MRIVFFQVILFLLIGLFVWAGCGNAASSDGSDGDSDGDGDGDSDGDADSDSDTDADGDTDSDGDTDTDSDGDSDTDSDADGDSDEDDGPPSSEDSDSGAFDDSDSGMLTQDCVYECSEHCWSIGGEVRAGSCSEEGFKCCDFGTDTGNDGPPSSDEPDDSDSGAFDDSESDEPLIVDTATADEQNDSESDVVDTDSPITIWIAGDSTVMNGSSCPIGWGQTLGALFTDNVTVDNRAIGGRSIRKWMYQVTGTMGSDGECVVSTDASGGWLLQSHWSGMLDNMKAGDYLLIQFGINDGDPTCDRHVGTAEYQRALGVMAEEAKALGAHPVFFTPLSMIRCSGSTAVGSRGFLDETFAAGVENDVPVIDLHQLSVDFYNAQGFCPLPSGYIDIDASTPGDVGAFFCDDHTHLDWPGAEAISGVITKALIDQHIELASWLE